MVIPSLILVIIGAALYAISLPPISLWWVSALILLPIWFTFDKTEKYKGNFWNGFIYGFCIFAFLFHWIPHSVSAITHLNIFICYLLIGFCFSIVGVLYGLLFMLIKFIWFKHPWLVIFILPGFEWVCLPVFPITMGYSWHASLGGVQAADIGGVYFLSSLCCLYSFLIYLGIKHITKRKWYWAASLILLLVQYSYGCYRIFVIHNSKVTATLNVSILQTGIPPIVKRDETNSTYSNVSKQLIDANQENKEAQLLVLPESIFVPTFKSDKDIRLTELRSIIKNNQGLVFGCNTTEDFKTYNSMAFIQNTNDQFTYYRKHKLLLLGEYLPMMKYTPKLAEKISDMTHTNEFAAGEKSVSFHFQEFKILPFICIESMYGQWVAQVNRELNDTDLLLNITEDGWFGTSKASALHLYALSFRAIEMRKPLVRCVNVGYSSFINEWGLEQMLDLENKNVIKFDPWEKHHFVAKVEKRSVFSFYAWGGYLYEYFTALCFGLVAIWFVLALWKSRKKA